MSRCCCNRFKVHTKRIIASLRPVTHQLILRNPVLEMGQKLCVQCRKKIEKMPLPAGQNTASTSEEEEEQQQQQGSSELSASGLSDHTLQQLNVSLSFCSKKKIQKSSIHTELKKVDSAIRKKLDLLSGTPAPLAETEEDYDPPA